MSILNEPYAVPSRVKGIVRYLLATRGQREKQKNLEALLSPTTLISKGDNAKISRNMVRNTIQECIKMGLLEKNEDGLEVAINPKLNLKENELSSILTRLLVNTPDLIENHDFARVLAWYLAQDLFIAPGNWPEAQQKLRDQIGGNLLNLNDARFGQFEYWCCFLGFGWHNSLSGNSVLVPDPTTYLRQNLDSLFDEINKQVPLGNFINRLGSFCPVFEAGIFRKEFGNQFGENDEHYLSCTTSLALRRLKEEGSIKLEKLADTAIFVLRDGEDSRISHITWLG